MPIEMLCPGCDGRLSTPASMAGKQVSCPHCRQVMQVPAAAEEFEITVEEPRPRRSRASYDDDYDDRARPQKFRKPKRKKQPLNLTPLYIFLGFLAAILIAGVSSYFLFFRNKDDAPAKSGSASKDTEKEKDAKQNDSNSGDTSNQWVRFDDPKGQFSASFLGGSPTARVPTDLTDGNTTFSTTWERKSPQMIMQIGYSEPQADMSHVSVPHFKSLIKAKLGPFYRSMQDTTVCGHQGVLVNFVRSGRSGVICYFTVNNRVFAATVLAYNLTTQANTPVVAEFLSKIDIK